MLFMTEDILFKTTGLGQVTSYSVDELRAAKTFPGMEAGTTNIEVPSRSRMVLDQPVEAVRERIAQATGEPVFVPKRPADTSQSITISRPSRDVS
jgi:hypothetical protein